jgi:transposase
MVAEQVEAKRLVFVDEMGTNTSLSPVYAWAKKGQRALCSVPRLFQGKNTTVLSSMSVRGMGPSLTVEGATTSAVFEAYVEQVLAPTLRKGQVVVMDNLSAHKGERIRELIEERGCELIYLPSYSPDFNPIEEAFSKIKGLWFARPKPGRKKPCSRRSVGRCLRSPPTMPVASSSTAATGCRFNHYGERCRGCYEFKRASC